jgi:L-lactate dehydrogenase complex protein LldE
LRARVVLWPTCLGALLYPRAGGAARRILARTGIHVDERKGAVCCGQPAWNSGHVADARRVASGAVEALAGEEPVVVCSGSCTTMVTHYWNELFAGTPRHGAALDVAGRARELSDFLANDVGVDALGRLELDAPRVVAYHDSCHMLRSLGIFDAPRRLLGAVSGLEVRELGSADRCCGFGGTFSVRHAELSTAMADDKVDDARSRGVDAIVAADIGCLLQISGRARARAVALEGHYVAEVVAAALSADAS